MKTNESKVILITGASSGIGEAAARHLAAKGHSVVLGARRADRLEKLAAEIREAGGAVEYRALDVTDLADVQAFAAFALEIFGGIDVLINNAGVMPLSPLAELKISEWNQMIDVNIRGVARHRRRAAAHAGPQSWPSDQCVLHRWASGVAHLRGLQRHQVCRARHF